MTTLFITAPGSPGAPTLEALFAKGDPAVKQQNHRRYRLAVHLRKTHGAINATNWVLATPASEDTVRLMSWLSFALTEGRRATGITGLHIATAVAAMALSELLKYDYVPSPEFR